MQRRASAQLIAGSRRCRSSTVAFGRKRLFTTTRATSQTAQAAEGAQITELSNKLRVVTDNTPGHFSSLGVYIDAGSRYESPAMSGASHVLDRMAFKATKGRTADEMSTVIDSLGGQMLCSSSRETIIFQSSHFHSATPIAMDVLADVVRNSEFLPDEVEAQREAAAYEIREINNKPEMILPEILHQVAYRNNTLGNPMLCPEERLPAIQPELLKEFTQTWFRPDRMVVAGAGMPHAELVKLAEQHFGSMQIPAPTDMDLATDVDRRLDEESSQVYQSTVPSSSSSASARIPSHLLPNTNPPSSSHLAARLAKSLSTAATSFLNPQAQSSHGGGSSSSYLLGPNPTFNQLAQAKAHYTGGDLFIPDSETEFNHVYLAFEGVSIHDPDIYALATLQLLLGGGGSFSAGGPGKGMYSRLYTQVLNRYPAMDHCSALHHIYSDTSLFGMVATAFPALGDGKSSNGGYTLNTTDMLAVLASQLSNLLYRSVPKRELERAKNQLMSSLVMALESQAVAVEDLGRQVLVHKRKVSVQEMCDKIMQVDSATIMRVAERIFGTRAEKQATVLIMGREDVKDWRSTLLSYGVGRMVAS